MVLALRWIVAFSVLCQLSLAASTEPRVRMVETPDGQRSYLSHDATNGISAPLLVFLHGEERASRETLDAYYRQWEPLVAAKGWHLVLPWTEGRFSFHSEQGLRAIRAVLEDFRSGRQDDPQRIYLAGHGDGAPGVFTAVSRMPHLWSAALAIGGDANRAIETNRLYAGNAVGIPLLWLYEPDRAPVLRGAIRRLEFAGMAGRFEAASEFRAEQAIEWLSQHTKPLLSNTVDYETGSLEFRGSAWAEIQEFDFTQRNDVLASTRVDPGTGAFLRLGGFGYDPEGQGPGVPVKWLPPNYKGPLRLEDRIVSISGKMIQDASHYAEIMEQQRESRDVGIILMRDGKNIRVETRIVIPQREESETARILAEYLPESKEILVVTRGVKSSLLRIPKEWAPVRLNWNGADLVTEAGAGCWLLEMVPSASVGPRRQSTDTGPVARPVPCSADKSASGSR